LNAAVINGIGSPFHGRGSPMQQQFFQVFRTFFNLVRGLIYIGFTIALLLDLNEIHGPIKTAIVVGAVLAALLLFDPLV
jgi:hypothetical protein